MRKEGQKNRLLWLSEQFLLSKHYELTLWRVFNQKYVLVMAACSLESILWFTYMCSQLHSNPNSSGKVLDLMHVLWAFSEVLDLLHYTYIVKLGHVMGEELYICFILIQWRKWSGLPRQYTVYYKGVIFQVRSLTNCCHCNFLSGHNSNGKPLQSSEDFVFSACEGCYGSCNKIIWRK